MKSSCVASVVWMYYNHWKLDPLTIWKHLLDRKKSTVLQYFKIIFNQQYFITKPIVYLTALRGSALKKITNNTFQPILYESVYCDKFEWSVLQVRTDNNRRLNLYTKDFLNLISWYHISESVLSMAQKKKMI